MTELTLIVGVEPFGERHRAVVHARGGPRVRVARDDVGDLLLSSVVRDTPRAAVVAALEQAASDAADEMDLS